MKIDHSDLIPDTKQRNNFRAYDVICRFLFLITIPVFVLNIVIAGIIALPFWIITGKAIYGTKMIQGFNSWHYGLYKNTK